MIQVAWERTMQLWLASRPPRSSKNKGAIEEEEILALSLARWTKAIQTWPQEGCYCKEKTIQFQLSANWMELIQTFQPERTLLWVLLLGSCLGLMEVRWKDTLAAITSHKTKVHWIVAVSFQPRTPARENRLSPTPLPAGCTFNSPQYPVAVIYISSLVFPFTALSVSFAFFGF